MPPVGAGVPIESRGYLRSWSGSSSARPEVQGPCRVRPRIPDSSSAHLCIPGSFPVHRCNAGSRSVRPRIPGSLLGLLRIPGSSFVRRCIPGSPLVHRRNAGSSSVHLGAKNGSGWTDREPRFHGRPESEPGFPSTARTRARNVVNGPNPNPASTDGSNSNPVCHGRLEPEPSVPPTAGTRTRHAVNGRNPNHVFTDRPSSIPASTDGRNPNPAPTAGTRTQHAASGPNLTPVFQDGRKPHPVCAGRPKAEFGSHGRAGSSPGIIR